MKMMKRKMINPEIGYENEQNESDDEIPDHDVNFMGLDQLDDNEVVIPAQEETNDEESGGDDLTVNSPPTRRRTNAETDL